MISLSHFLSQLKQTMTLIDSLSADHMHSEQTFLSAALKSAQAATDARTEHLQKHLTNTIAQTAEVEAAMQRQVRQCSENPESIRGQLPYRPAAMGKCLKNSRYLV